MFVFFEKKNSLGISRCARAFTNAVSRNVLGEGLVQVVTTSDIKFLIFDP